jgi:hypothetical protein
MKSFLLLPLMLLAITFTGCTKKEYVQPNRTVTTSIPATAWKLDAAKNTYYAEVNMPEITQRVFDTYGVLTYFSFDGDTYEAIPDVLDGSTFEVTHAVGLLSIDTQGADGSLVNPPGATIYLKIVLVASDL